MTEDRIEKTMLRVFTQTVVLQETPGHVSLAFAVSGCPGNCPNCSWKQRDLDTQPQELSIDDYEHILDTHVGTATCVLFLGGDWNSSTPAFLKLAQDKGFRTCLYTGLDDVGKEFKSCLDYLKTGAYIDALGGLDSPTTNQRYVDLRTGADLTYLFRK